MFFKKKRYFYEASKSSPIIGAYNVIKNITVVGRWEGEEVKNFVDCPVQKNLSFIFSPFCNFGIVGKNMFNSTVSYVEIFITF